MSNFFLIELMNHFLYSEFVFENLSYYFFHSIIATYSGILENRMEGKTVLGLKTAPIPLLQDDNEEEDDIDFFESDTKNDQGLIFSLKPQPAINPDLTPISLTPHKNIMKITSFEEASPLITSFLSSIPDFQIPPPFEGSLYFVPDHVMNEQYSEELDRFAKDSDPNSEFNLDLVDAHINVLAQISIVKFFKGQNIDFSHFLDDNTLNVIDNRIISLIHYCMSKSNDRQVSSYHRIHSISEFIKTPSVAPISTLFPDFTLQKISHDLCTDLISMFPHHPLLPSLVDKFNSIVDPTANDLLSLIPEDDDEDTDFSDSFLESIESVQKKPQPLININSLNSFNESIPNALEICQSTYSNIIMVALQEPPSMVTYKHHIRNISDSAAQLTPNLFQDWVKSLYPRLKEYEKLSPFVLPTKISKQQKQLYRKSEEKFQSMPTSLRIDSDDEELSLSSENLLQVISYQGPMSDLQTMFGTIFSPSLFPLNYTIAHMIYSDPKLQYKPRNFIYPSVIENEYKGHKISDNQSFSEVIENLQNLVNKYETQNEDETPKEVKIESLQNKRDLPNKETEPPPSTVPLLALSDIEFIMHERSPLTFDHNSSQPPISKDPEKQTRGQKLFEIYSKYVYPPYLTFRAAVALALNVLDSDATLAINFLFEGIYVLLYTYPQMLRVDFVRNVILYLAELLEKQDQYYYSSLFFDVFYLSNQNDMKHSNEIALLCQKNLDSVRAVFHFTQSMKYLVNEAKTDEALYLAQVLASIYNEYSDYESPISILSFLLKDTFDFISITQKIADQPPLPPKNTGSLQPRKAIKASKPPQGRQFKPQADQLNTILTGTSLCEFLIKTRHFSSALKLLSSLHASNGNTISNTLLSFVDRQSLLKRNLFKEFLKSISDLQFKSRRNSPNVKLSVLAAASFDNSLATVRLLISGYLKRELFRYSLLWSEAYITAQPKMAMKDIGYGFLARGMSLYQALHHIHSMSPPYSLYAIYNTISSKLLSYADENNKDFKSYKEILTEALSSLKAAIICLDKVGSQRQLSYSYLLYADLLLMHFFDSEFEKLNCKNLNSSSHTSLNENLNENDEDEIRDINTESDGEFEAEDDDILNDTITISEPVMRIKINNFPSIMSKVVYFPPTTISKLNLVDELRQVFRRIDSIVTKCMNPIYIIYYQALLSKYLFLQKKIQNSKTVFDYAYNNMKKFFFNGDELICKDVNLPTISLFKSTLMNMGIALLFYDKNFINDRLMVFDWIRNIHTLYQNQIRVVTEENKEQIEPRLEVSINSLNPMKSLKVTDFLKTLKEANVENSKSKSSNDDITSISKCLSCINANIRLFETGKTSEDEMHLNNMTICKQIEQIADEFRRSSDLSIPIDMTYSYVVKAFPMVQGLIYLQHLNDSIYLYRPSDGQKKRILLTSISHTDSDKPLPPSTASTTSTSAMNISVSANSTPINTNTNNVRTQSTSSLSSIASSSSFSSFSSDLTNYLNTSLFKGSTISTMTNKGEITYNSTSSLFSPKFIEIIALFLMCDKKQRHDQFNSRLARKLCTETKEALFGSSLDDLNAWPKVADKHFFGENRIFGKGLKGAFCSVKTSKTPSIFITSLDLNALPLELMFPNVLVIRVRSYTRFISNPADNKQEIQGKYPRIKICRIRQNPYHMMKVAIRRSKDITSEFISGIGGDIPQLQTVFDNDRSMFYPFSLFSSNNSNLYYIDKFTFCDIIELSSESSVDLNIKTIINSYLNNNNNDSLANNINTTTNNKSKDSKANNIQTQIKVSLFLFTYSDLAEMPLLLEKLIDMFPLSYFMFIPAQFVREAFQQMLLIFDRHQRRIKFIEDHPDDASLAPHKDICNNIFDFITLLQATLIQTLDCPIPLFVPPQ